MKKLLSIVFLSLSIYGTATAQQVYDYLSIQTGNGYIKMVITSTLNDTEELVDIPKKTPVSSAYFKKIQEYEKDGWALWDTYFYSVGTTEMYRAIMRKAR